jgi:hypothetical protein
MPTANQPWNFTTDWTIPVGVTDLRNFWFAALSEPVRRRDIPQSNQSWDFTMDWKWTAPVAVAVTYSMVATEIADVLRLAVSGDATSAGSGAQVSITEIGTLDAAVRITEIEY